MIQDTNALLRRYQDELARTLTRALVAEQALAEAVAQLDSLKAASEGAE